MYRTSEKTSLSRKMAELEERWRKSQEDRYLLELKFKEVLKGLADKNEGSKLLKLREKYYLFLENEDKRNERNDMILRSLDKIESQANMLSAKTERLKLLKLHYEAYMKRMYPDWKLDNGEYEGTPPNKESIYPARNKHEKRNVSYCLPRREDHMPSRLSHDIPRYTEKSYYSSNNLLQTRSPNESGNAIPSQTKREKNRLLSLNHDISNKDLNSKEKSDNSRSLSFEQEENTSKDLLNVSLSDDLPVNGSTMPIDKEKTPGSSHKESTNTESKRIEIDNSVNHEYPVNSYANNVNGNNNLVLNEKIKEEVSNEIIEFGGSQSYNNNPNGIQNDRNGYSTCKEQDVSEKLDQAKINENIEVGANQSEIKPIVMINQPTPDIGKASSEEDLSKKEMLTKDVGDEKERCHSSHNNSLMVSEAEASDGERIEGESSDNFGKVRHSPMEELSPRSAVEVGGLQENIENAFQFSSSDADYEELENQMAALVDGKRNDKSIPKVFGNSKFQEVSNDELQAGEVDNAEEISQVTKEVDDNKDIYDEVQVLDGDEVEERLGNNIIIPSIEHTDFKTNEYGDNQEMEKRSLGINNEHGYSNNNQEVNQGDKDKHNETFGSSVDVNSEILDEDHNTNADEAMLQPEEYSNEFSDIRKANYADEDNFNSEDKVQEECNASNEFVEQKVEYNHEREYNVEEDRLKEFENEPEVKSDNREYYEQKDSREHYDIEDINKNAEEGGNRNFSSIKEDSKHDEVEQHDINEEHHRSKQENHSEYEDRHYEEDIYDVERHETIENAGNEEEFDEYGRHDEEAEIKDIYERNQEVESEREKHVEEENYADNEGTEELGQDNNEDWESEKYEQGDTTELREEENYTRQQDIEEVVYERPDMTEEAVEQYDRHSVEQDEERNYETRAVEEQTKEDYISHHDTENEEYDLSRGKQVKVDYDEGYSVENEQDQYDKVGNKVVREPEIETVEYEKHGVPNENSREVEQNEGLECPVPEQEKILYERENEQFVTHERLEDEKVIASIGEDEIEKDREPAHESIREMEDRRLNQGIEERITEEIHSEEGDINLTYEKDEVHEENQNSGKYEAAHVEEIGVEMRHSEEIGLDLNSGSKVSEKEIIPQKTEILEDEALHIQSCGDEEVQNIEKNGEEMLDVQPEREVVVSESITCKNSEEMKNVEPQKEVLVSEPKKEIFTKGVIKAEAKDSKKLAGETAKDKKEAVKKSTEPSVAEHHIPEKHERNVKESTNMASRPLSRQYGKKDYDPHKVEKLKSTIRKFQLKKDSKLEKPGRKLPESKK